MNQNDLYIEYARVIEMCKGTALEGKPWVCVKFEEDVLEGSPYFDCPPESYEFAIAILEDRAVFVGDTLYWKTTGEEYIVNSYNKCTSMPLGYMTWQPPKPKRTFMLNGVELPCPVKKQKKESSILLLGGAVFYFESEEDTDSVCNSFLSILTDARDKS